MVKIVRKQAQSQKVKVLTGCSPVRRSCPNEGGGSGGGGGQSCVPGEISQNSTFFEEQTSKKGVVSVTMKFCSSPGPGSGPQEGNTAQRRVYTNATGGTVCCGDQIEPGNERAEGPVGQEQIGECIKMCFSTNEGSTAEEECCCQELLNKLLSAHMARLIAQQERF